MIRRLFASQPDAELGGRAGALAGARGCRGRRQSVTQLSAGQPFFFIPYPQYPDGLNVLDSNDFSTYNALEVQFQRRLYQRHLVQRWPTPGRSRWTRARSIRRSRWSARATRPPPADTPFDINNRRLNYAPADFDRRHVLQWNLVCGASVRQGQALARQRFAHAQSGGGRLGSHRLRPRDQRPAVHGVLRAPTR